MNTITNNEITFRWATDDIFNEVAKKTAIYAREREDKNGKSMLDAIAITEDERFFVVSSIELALYDIFEKVVRLTENDSVGIVINSPENKKMVSGFKLSFIDLTSKNKNTIELLDKIIYNIIVDLVIFEWCCLNGIYDENIIRAENIKAAVKQMDKYISYLKRASIETSFSISVF